MILLKRFYKRISDEEPKEERNNNQNKNIISINYKRSMTLSLSIFKVSINRYIDIL